MSRTQTYDTAIGRLKRPEARFWAYARERHAIYLRRAAGEPEQRWTRDTVLQKFRFTNVYRELDKTTAWFRQHVRDPMRDSENVLMATVVFRMLNRIAVGEAIFKQLTMPSGKKTADTAFELFQETGDTRFLSGAIRQFCGKGPYVTGGYIISTPSGYSKLDGVMWILEQFRRESHGVDDESNLGAGAMEWNCSEFAEILSTNKSWSKKSEGALVGMEDTWKWLRQFPYLGSFHSYEIVCDLRYTALLENAPDRMTWANPGPGARRGLNRIHGRELKLPIKREQAIDEMRALLEMAPEKFEKHFEDCVPWEMREVEHTLCEFDKMERTRLGEGTPRGRFR